MEAERYMKEAILFVAKYITVRVLWFMAGFVLVAAVFAIAGCSDQYRYPCQDPANQASKECNPPECVADGTCTDYLVEIHK
jgi:hypothetical protein